MYLSYLAQFNTANNNANAANHSSQLGIPGNHNFGYEAVDEVLNFLLNASQQLKLAFDHMKLQSEILCEATINQIRVQAEMDKREVLMKDRNDIVNIIRNLSADNGDVIVQQLLTQLQMENTKTNKICSNCGRDAYLECTACKIACYCSPFCQKKNWIQHQNDCTLQQLYTGSTLNRTNIDSTVGCTQKPITFPAISNTSNPTNRNAKNTNKYKNASPSSKQKDVSR